MTTIENFVIKIPNSITHRPNLRPLIASILIACLLTYPIMGFSTNAIFCNIILQKNIMRILTMI